MFEVLGQEFPKKYFAEAVKNNKIAHSYILEGPDGVGKSIFALHMAETLLCRNEHKPCGVCNSCRKVEKLTHPDVKVVDNEKKSIGVNEIRDMIDEAATRPYEGDSKIFIVKKADTMTTEAQNALLKTLEEPPHGVKIILLVSNIEVLLPTIQSRCQMIRLGRVSLDTILDYLEKRGHDKGKAAIAAELSDGILGRALMQLDNRYEELRRRTIEFASRITRTDPLTGIDQAKLFIDNKEQMDFIFETLNIWNRDIYMYKATKSNHNIINKDFYDLLIEQSQLLSYNRLDRIMDTLKNTEQKIKRNANFQLAIEMMLFKYQEI